MFLNVLTTISGAYSPSLRGLGGVCKCLIWCMLFGWSTVLYGSPDTLRIVSYNMENLFDNRHDTLKNDLDFTPEGTHHWTYRRYQAKVERIAQVLTAIGGWQSTDIEGLGTSRVPVLVGLCEVENDRCLRSLCWYLRRYRYKYIHYESPDERGIDVALLYDSTRFHLLHSEPIPVPLPSAPTRDILYVQGALSPVAIQQPSDTFHLFICHLPSQLGGTSETEWKRAVAKSVLQSRIDSLLTVSPSANVIVMGDMNSAPANDLIGMTNLMLPNAKNIFKAEGTHKYNSIWTYFDQFYVSQSLTDRVSASVFAPTWLLEEDTKYLGVKPRRTFNGYHYRDAYSDHLPIVLTLTL